MRLFSISSPLIFYFAQSIASDFNDKNNISLLWFSGGHEDHLKTYNLLKDDNVWKNGLVFKGAVDYNLTNAQKIIKRKKTIQEKESLKELILEIFRKEGISEVYIGNRHMPFDRLLYFIAKENNIQINLLEDGLTNYLDFNYSNNQTSSLFSKDNIKSLLKKWFYQKDPLNFIFNNDKELLFKYVYASFPEKHVIGNSINGVKQLNLSKYNDIYYDKVKAIVQSDQAYQLLLNDDKKNILLLSQALSEDNLISLDDELEVITKYIADYRGGDFRVFIKPHPRDNLYKINSLEKKLKKQGVNVFVLQNDVPIPVEVLLTQMKLTEIIGVWTAALFYSYIIDNNIKNTSILPYLIKESSNTVKLERVYNNLKTVFNDEINWK
ncbi:polysialyltransferase family glycosyltransferase [Halalkalibacter kiskunsagensis]|uniref:Polysialyltransferase family glycosyltransferase n=1 Tax=Halalkalibacter kiskunsagensis TaxID=1548599 RepID=A0ABV6KG97_9BACI